MSGPHSPVPSEVTKPRMIVGMTGSIAVLRAAEFLLRLRKIFEADTHVMMSESATRFITPYSLELYSGNPVHVGSERNVNAVAVPHIELVKSCRLLLVMPATANILGKCAAGICDDHLSTSIVACRAPVLFVPCMNEQMWFSPVVQRNVASVRALGHTVFEPEEGVEISDLSPTFGVLPSFQQMLERLAPYFDD